MSLILFLVLASFCQGDEIQSAEAKNAIREHTLEVNRIERARFDGLEQAKKTLIAKLASAKEAATKAGDLDDAIRIRKQILDLENPPQSPSAEKRLEEREATIRSLEERLESLSNTPGSKRQSGINGTWRWFDGSDIVFTKSGDARQANGLKGVWRPMEGRKDGIKIIWSNGSIDTLTVSNDGIQLDGRATDGLRVWAVKITN